MLVTMPNGMRLGYEEANDNRVAVWCEECGSAQTLRYVDRADARPWADEHFAQRQFGLTVCAAS